MENNIRILRIIALLLFIAPALGLVGSLLINNYLVTFNFNPDFNYNFEENRPGNSVSYICNKENDYCSQTDLSKFKEIEKFKTLDECNIYEISHKYYYKDGENLNDLVLQDIPEEWDNFDAIIGEHRAFNSLKV